ncbi:Argonaute linker 2 domain [Fusarium oxysporum f. sp. vasinfectum]|nr:Argonaute linker 2 domain [Fusarium oxysporum f. sp. vasinfectum]
MLERFLKFLRPHTTHLPEKRNKANEVIPRVKTIFGLARKDDGHGLAHPPRVRQHGAGAKDVEFWLDGRELSIFYLWEHTIEFYKTSNFPEVCVVLPGQPSKSKLDGTQAQQMIRHAVRKPWENAAAIVREGVQTAGLDENINILLQSFGLGITPGLIKVPGRVLVGPKVIYKGNKTAGPRFGSWNMMDIKFNIGASLTKWSYLIISLPGARDSFDQHSLRALNRFQVNASNFNIQMTLRSAQLYNVPLEIQIYSSSSYPEQTYHYTRKAHPEGRPEMLLVIKDSWQYPERDEEGELLREATDKGAVNVARYYHHETVQIDGVDDDIRNNVRRGLDITQAANYRPERPIRRNNVVSGTSRERRGSTSARRKRSSRQVGAPLPSSKRSCSVSSTRAASSLPNRVHRRVILRDYGMPIYKASSRSALLAAFDRCIEGHESLYKAGFLHRDISINNLMINEDDDNPSWPSFLIDLDLAIKESREAASGAKGKTGTRAFMAIGALLGEQHSVMHDLESFFWVLFWICIHYNGADEARIVLEFDKWNYVDMGELANLKKGQVSHEGDFIKTAEENFTSYYQPLVPWVNRLRKVVFPNGGRWERGQKTICSGEGDPSGGGTGPKGIGWTDSIVGLWRRDMVAYRTKSTVKHDERDSLWPDNTGNPTFILSAVAMRPHALRLLRVDVALLDVGRAEDGTSLQAEELYKSSFLCPALQG